MLAAPATAAAPVHLNSDGNCTNPPSSSKTVDLSAENPYVVIDFGRSELTEGSVIWTLTNLDTGFVVGYGVDTDALRYICTFAPGPKNLYRLHDDTLDRDLLGTDLSLARYLLHLQTNAPFAYKNLRFSTVP